MIISKTSEAVLLDGCKRIYNKLYPEYEGNCSGISSPDQIYYIAHYGTQAFGFIVVSESKNNRHIDRICVREAFHNQGIGSDLVKHIINVTMPSSGKITATTHRTSFFSRLGFLPEDARYKADHAPDKKYLNPIDMILRL